MAFDLLNLQNGSDICGIAMKGTAGEDVILDEITAGRIAGSFMYWLTYKVNKNPVQLKVCIGYDSRVTAGPLKEGLMKGITMFGGECYDAGVSSTSAMFMATVLPQFEFDGAIMITAGDMPYNMNGFKFFTAEGSLDEEDVARILQYANKYTFIGEYYEDRPVNVMQMYAAYLRQMISFGLKDDPEALKDMHIVVDAGNGAGGFFAKDVLAPLGVNVMGSQFLEPDGTFPNHKPDTVDKDALASIRRAVLYNKADLGIILDTDVERVAAVGPDGTVFAGSTLIAAAAALAAEDYPGGTIVTDSATSVELNEFLENNLGLRHLRHEAGFNNVVSKARELREAGENAFLAMDTSGYAAFADNNFLSDGAFLAVQIVINAARLKAEGKNINALIEEYTMPAESWSVRFSLTAENHEELADQILAGLTDWANNSDGFWLEEPNCDGVRVNFDIDNCKGWLLMRKCLNEAVLPMDIVSSDKGGIRKVLPLLGAFLSDFEGIELPE